MANIIKTSFNVTLNTLQNPDYDRCEHAINLSTAYALTTESDSFGLVGGYIECKTCFEKAREEEAEQTTCCDDCKQQVKNKDITNWRWYDFYAPQGDEAYKICNTCWTAPKHVARMKQDRLDRDEEMNYDNDMDNQENEVQEADNTVYEVCTNCNTYKYQHITGDTYTCGNCPI